MVEVDSGEGDWLNGTGLMPHERAGSENRSVRRLSAQVDLWWRHKSDTQITWNRWLESSGTS